MGKSNISDAILFVLGPTSSKALRADRLTHLLFNGGAAKKSATECEVSLVFDNHDRALPIRSDEVEVGRYVKLAPTDPDGYYSYFYLNGRRTTRPRSTPSFPMLASRVTATTWSSRGTSIASSAWDPSRGGLVERLAGISQYDDELQKAEARRTDLETNLGRITTLLGGSAATWEVSNPSANRPFSTQDVQDQGDGPKPNSLVRVTSSLSKK